MESISKVNVAFRMHMTKEEAEQFAFPENFYHEFVVPHLGIDPNDETFMLDCREISVSQELFDFWQDLFIKKQGEAINSACEFNMAWLEYGPTTDEDLHGFEICASDKFVKWQKEDK